MPPLPAFPVEAAVAVAADTPCRKCQYNLRGLSADGRCPECGTPVGFSVRGDLLRYSDPAWVGTLRVGVLCILWAIAVAIGGGIIGGVATAMTGSRAPARLLPLGGTTVSLVGAWLLTTPDPSGIGEDRYGTSRKLIRVTLVVDVVHEFVQVVQQTVTVPPAAGLALAVVGGAAAIVGLVGKFATLNYLAKLARRLPDDALAARARLLMYGYTIPVSGIVLVGLAVQVVTRFGGRSPAVVIGMVATMIPFGIALLVFGIMYLIMLVRFANAFDQQAKLARATWTAAAA